MLENKYNINIWQGSTFGLTISLKDSDDIPKDLSGQSARMQIRSSYDSPIIIESLTSSNGEITFTESANGTFHLELDATRTSAIPVDLSVLATVQLESGDSIKIPRQKYVYDLELIDGNLVTKILYGDVFVYGEVTR